MTVTFFNSHTSGILPRPSTFNSRHTSASLFFLPLLFSGGSVVMFETMSLSGSGSVDMGSLGRQLRFCLPLIIVPGDVAKV